MSSCNNLQPLIKINLRNKLIENRLIKIIEENQLTVSKLNQLDLSSLGLFQFELDYMEILKHKAQLLVNRPIGFLRMRKLFRGVWMPNQNLNYTEARTFDNAGFFHSLDASSRVQREKKLKNLDTEKATKAKMKEMKKYGQVVAVPNIQNGRLWKWQFSWTEIEHPALSKYITKKETTFRINNVVSREKEELVSHLAGELYYYFRTGIPGYYLNQMLEQLILDFPCFDDKVSCFGYDWLRPLVVNSFYALTRIGNTKPETNKYGHNFPNVRTSLRSLTDEEIVIEVFQRKLNDVSIVSFIIIILHLIPSPTKIKELIETEPSIRPLSGSLPRLEDFRLQVCSFITKYKTNKSTSFFATYPTLKWHHDKPGGILTDPVALEQIAIHLIHNSLTTDGLIVHYNEEGNGIFFKLDAEFIFSNLADGMPVTGSVMAGDSTFFSRKSLLEGLFIICGINTILGLNYPNGHEHILVYIEKEFLGISRAIHTPQTTKFNKSLSRRSGGKKRKITGTDK